MISTYLKFSKTIQRWPLCSKYLSSLIMCFLSSGSAWNSFCSISISLAPAFLLRKSVSQCGCNGHEGIAYIVSLFRINLIATKLCVTVSVARTTPENMPLPRFDWT